jgi:hypothetical protein
MSFFNPKFVALVAVLLLSACSSSEKQPIADRSPEATPLPSSNPIADAPPAVPLGKAKATCGDALPKDEKAYPVSFYPIFVSYSDKNLELVKKHFCEDAIKRRSEKLGKDVVQVGSFTSKERASALKSELSGYLKGVDVGEPTIIQSSIEKVNTTQNIGREAKLSPQQVTELQKVVGVSKDFQTQEVVILPSDIPGSFKVKHFSTRKQKFPTPRFAGGRYTISYENNQNECFSIEGGVIQPMGDEPTKYEKVISLSSPALGTVDLGITDVDTIRGGGFIGFTQSAGRIFIGKNEYSFSSPGGMEKCNRISQKDAVQLVRSIQFLNP